MHRTFRCALAAGASVVTLTMAPATAQQWPTKPVRIIVPVTPAGPLDFMARTLAQKLGDTFGQTFIIDNRPGANGIIGNELAARSPADGYTLLTSTNSMLVMNRAAFDKLSFDPVNDFAPVTIVLSLPFALFIHPSLPAKNVQEFVAHVRTRPGEYGYGSFGPASVPQFAMELFMSKTGTRMNHVPFKGGVPVATALAAGEIKAVVDSIQNQLPFIKSNRVRTLALAAPRRIALMPDLPTLTEAGVSGADSGGWYAMLTPAGTPQAIVQRLHSEISKAMKSPDVRERYAPTGSELVLNTPAEFKAVLRSEIERWTRIAREANIKAY